MTTLRKDPTFTQAETGGLDDPELFCVHLRTRNEYFACYSEAHAKRVAKEVNRQAKRTEGVVTRWPFGDMFHADDVAQNKPVPTFTPVPFWWFPELQFTFCRDRDLYISGGWGRRRFLKPICKNVVKEPYPFGGAPTWGIQSMDDRQREFWLRLGHKNIGWRVPFVSLNISRTEIVSLDGKAIVETFTHSKESSFDHMDYLKRKKAVLKSNHAERPYNYHRKNGKVQTVKAKIHIERTIWKRHWFPFLEIVKPEIHVEFSSGVGEKTGTWKGGVYGTSEPMRPGEDWETTYTRMERNRVFK